MGEINNLLQFKIYNKHISGKTAHQLSPLYTFKKFIHCNRTCQSNSHGGMKH